MSSIRFLIAAYVATWLIHGTYVATLVRRFSRLKKDLDELGKNGKSASR